MICRNILHSFAFLPHYFVCMFHVPQDEIKIAKQEQQEMLKNVADKAVNKTLGKGKSI